MASNFNQQTSCFDKIIEHTAKNQTALLGLILVVVLGAAGYYGYSFQTQRYETKAQTAYFVGQQAYQDALIAVTPKPAPIDKTKKVAAPPVEQVPDYKKAETATAESKLQDVLKDFPTTNASFQAALLLSDIYKTKDQPTKAVEVLESKSNQKSPSKILGAVLDLKLSSLYEQNKQCDKAIAVLENVANNKDTPEFKPESVLRQALCNETLGHNDKAKELYEKLSTEFPDTQQGQQATKYLQLLSDAGGKKSL